MTMLKHSFFIIALFLFSFLNVYAQDASLEPEFVGESVILNADNTTQSLEKSHVQVKTKANAGLYIVGIGSVKSRLVIASGSSSVRVPQSSGDIRLIVRATDNKVDPLSIIRIFRFDAKKKERRAELSSLSTFGGESSGNMNLVKFSGKKFGVDSYILTISGLTAGEYGVIVQNPNALDEKTIIASCFGIDGTSADAVSVDSISPDSTKTEKALETEESPESEE